MAEMHSGQILHSFRWWSQQDLLMYKVWGERRRGVLTLTGICSTGEKDRQIHRHVNQRQSLEETGWAINER